MVSTTLMAFSFFSDDGTIITHYIVRVKRDVRLFSWSV